MTSGAAVVREPAGSRDVAKRRRSGGTAADETRYKAETIANRAQLLELARRGERAQERIAELLDPLHVTPLTRSTGLRFEVAAGGVIQPHADAGAGAYVRLLPLTPTERFSAWATTHEAAGALIDALEELTGLRGLGGDWATPHAAGVTGNAPVNDDRSILDGLGQSLTAHAHIAVDQAGIVTAAFTYREPPADLRGWTSMDQLEERMVAPLIDAAATLLQEAEFLGRTACHVVLNRVQALLLLQSSSEAGPASYVPVQGTIELPGDTTQVSALARRAINGLARSAGIPAWDSMTTESA